MKIDILTLFPDMFAPLEHSIVGKAQEKGLLEINYHNFRENAEKARHVDDEPYGGGQGMLLRAQPMRKNWLKKRSWSLSVATMRAMTNASKP